MPPVWVTIPTFNEAGNIERVLRMVDAQLTGEYRILVVDDASPDGTADLAEALAGELSAVEVLRRDGRPGLGRAYLAGFERALAGGAEIVVVLDADLSHDPRHLPALLAEITNADLVLGSRYVPGGEVVDWPPLRRLLSRAGSLYARLVLGVGVRDLTGGFRAVRREVIERIEPHSLRAQGYVFNIEFTYRALRAGFRVREVPIRFADRTVGESKISLPIAIEALWLVPALRFEWLAETRLWRRARRRASVRPLAAGVAEQMGERLETQREQDLDDQIPREVGQPG